MLDCTDGKVRIDAIIDEINSKEDKIPDGADTIGVMGEIGAGVAAYLGELPEGWIRLAGHNSPVSDNYGNVLDNTGSYMVWIPAFYFKWDPLTNTVDITHTPTAGYALHRAFIDDGKTKAGFFIDKFQCGNVDGTFVSRPGLDPCSTSSDHNPISALANSPSNNYGGLYKAVKTRSDDHFLTSIFIYNALAMIAHAQGQAGTNCAFSDVAPYHPKGNNNNALSDGNDTSIIFEPSGYSSCALTGSGVPFAKTTHNGQNSGVADLNGNMWEVASGFIKYGASDAMFKLIKESARMGDIMDDNTTQGSGGAYDIDLYDDLDLTGSMAQDASSRFGNTTSPVFAMSTDRATQQYRMTCAGLPMAGGYSSAGTSQMGSASYREYWRDQMAPIVGGTWGNFSYAGVFALTVGHSRSNSYGTVGGRASVYL